MKHVWRLAIGFFFSFFFYQPDYTFELGNGLACDMEMGMCELGASLLEIRGF